MAFMLGQNSPGIKQMDDPAEPLARQFTSPYDDTPLYSTGPDRNEAAGYAFQPEEWHTLMGKVDPPRHSRMGRYDGPKTQLHEWINPGFDESRVNPVPMKIMFRSSVPHLTIMGRT